MIDDKGVAYAVPAESLCLDSRFDIAIKYMYAKGRLTDTMTDWHRGAYRDHIQAFNAFTEFDAKGSVTKVGESAFFEAFDEIIDSIAERGFDRTEPIPVSLDLRPLNGAHRAAACLAAKVQPFVISQNADSRNYDYRHFEKRGMPLDSMDVGALGFVDLSSDVRIAVVFGCALKSADFITESLSQVGHVLYGRSISLTRLGTDNLIRELYAGAKWLGSRESGFSGASAKSGPCFPPGAPKKVQVILFRPVQPAEALVDLKEQVRSKIGLGNHSIHMTDTMAEVEQLAPLFFTRNGRHLLNNRRPVLRSAFEHDFEDLQVRISDAKVSPAKVAVVGSATLALYGVRDSRDIDFVVVPQAAARGSNLDLSNDHLRKFGLDPHAIVCDPRHHIVYRGYKFVSLETLRKFKAARGEAKDEIDLSLIKLLLNHNPNIKQRVERRVRLLQLYSNPRWLRSFVSHWLTRLGLRGFYTRIRRLRG